MPDKEASTTYKNTKQSEKHGQVMESYAQAAQKHDESIEECVQAEIEQRKESELHIKALKEYLKLVKDKISRWKEFL